MVQALIKGEIDFAEEITALQVRALEGEDGITAQNGDSRRLRRDRVQHRGRRPETEEPHRATATRRSRTRRSATRCSFAIDRERIVERRLPGRR